MHRRDFLTLFLIGTSTALAEDGLLIESSPTAGLLMVPPEPEKGAGLLIDELPAEIVDSAKPLVVHIYSPATWKCPPCNTAKEALESHPGIRVVVHKNDVPPTWSNGGFPILHWAEGANGWQAGWHGIEAFVAKAFGDESQPPKKVAAVTVQDRGGSHWSVAGDWSPSREKTINHLVSVHGYSRPRIAALNLGQLLTLHDMAHEGRKVSQPQAAYCPTCPTTGMRAASVATPRKRSFLFWEW